MACQKPLVWPFPVMAGLLIAIAGCGGNNPFETVPVSGKVSYMDGSRVEASQITVTFIPQNIPFQGKAAPGSAVAYIDVENGSFSAATTRKPKDGAIVGPHKVMVQAMEVNQITGFFEPTNAIEQRYGLANQTPIEVEVTHGGKNYFELKVEKGKEK